VSVRWNRTENLVNDFRGGNSAESRKVSVFVVIEDTEALYIAGAGGRSANRTSDEAGKDAGSDHLVARAGEARHAGMGFSNIVWQATDTHGVTRENKCCFRPGKNHPLPSEGECRQPVRCHKVLVAAFVDEATLAGIVC
jgi:hypothetical protein